MNKTSKRILAVGLPLATIAATGIAFAAWTSTGSGLGTAKSTTISNVTYTAGTTLSQVYPTGTSDVVASVSNPNSYKAALSAFSLTAVYDAADANLGNLGTGGTQPTDIKSTCDLSLTVPAGLVVPAGASSITVVNGLAMGNNAVNSCAGKTFALALTSTATSSAAVLNASV